MEGWIKLHRKISLNPIWTSEKFTDGQAWVDLLLLANHRKSYIKVRGIRIDLEPGECGYSETSLAERWKWSRGKVRRFLDFLVQQNMINVIQQNNHVTSIISILNYSEYQGNGTTNSTTNGQQTVQQTDTNKNDNNDKKEKTTLCDNISEWRKNFETYISEVYIAFEKIKIDSIWIAEQEKYNPNINIILSIEKSIKNFWGTESGWSNKKKTKTQNIDWKQTFAKTLSFNKVYKQNGTHQQLTARSAQTRQQLAVAAENLMARLTEG